jgi:hypothetical protein
MYFRKYLLFFLMIIVPAIALSGQTYAETLLFSQAVVTGACFNTYDNSLNF